MAPILRLTWGMKKYQTIDAHELHQRMASHDRPVLVNALAREAFDRERIPGSISIPVGDAMRLAGDVLAKDQPVVVYCSSRSCTASPTLAQKLVDVGFTEVLDFEGGVEEWESAGYPMQRARELATA
ncbi:MAG TPA: rhodanese-like domain-containing protein [Methylomirabilota bacterium]|nr:rhodanese-like domain-containing protein [Methylomirabilota bacterium]